MDLPQMLKIRRKELGLTLLDIAKKMQVAEATVQRWESGNIKSLRHGRVAQLSEILGITPAQLMGWADGTAFAGKASAAPHAVPSASDLLQKLEQRPKLQELMEILAQTDDKGLDVLIGLAKMIDNEK